MAHNCHSFNECKAVDDEVVPGEGPLLNTSALQESGLIINPPVADVAVLRWDVYAGLY